MLALWQEAEKRNTLGKRHREELQRPYERQWKYQQEYRSQRPARRPSISYLDKRISHKFFKERQKAELYNLTTSVKEFTARERDPEYQARVREIRRLEGANRFIIDHDLTHYMDDDMRLAVEREREYVKAREEENVRWKADIDLAIAEADAKDRKQLDIHVPELVIGVLFVGFIILAVAP